MPEIQQALGRLLKKLGSKFPPFSLVSQFLPVQYARIRAGDLDSDARTIMLNKVFGRVD